MIPKGKEMKFLKSLAKGAPIGPKGRLGASPNNTLIKL
jgi:hypothetical protein